LSNDNLKIAVLADVADRIEDAVVRTKLGRLAKQIESSHSCLSDLRYATQILEFLERAWLAKGLEEHHKLLIHHSLTSNAVILYARSTSGGGRGDGRGSVDITAKLDTAGRENHAHIIEFRNKIIAHVHVGHELQGYAWNASHAIVVGDPNGWRIGAFSSPVNFREPIVKALGINVPIALEIVLARYDRYLDVAVEILKELKDFDPVTKSMQDARNLLHNEEMVQSVIGTKTGATFGYGFEN
jgi:hypothetical protein